jgi:hypothetical protein
VGFAHFRDQLLQRRGTMLASLRRRPAASLIQVNEGVTLRF